MFDLYKYTDKEKEKLLYSMTIIVDTREKKNEHIINQFMEHGVHYTKRKLDYGDYSFMIPKDESLGINKDIWFDKKVIIERKANLDEIAQNLTKERARFKHELVMSKDIDSVLLIEGNNFEDIVKHNYQTELSSKSLICNLMAFDFRYHLPFFFIADNRFSWVFIRYYFYNYLNEYLKGNVQ